MVGWVVDPVHFIDENSKDNMKLFVQTNQKCDVQLLFATFRTLLHPLQANGYDKTLCFSQLNSVLTM